MARRAEHSVSGAFLDSAASVHDDDPATEFADQRQIVGNEHHRQSARLIETQQQFNDLSLHGDVECGSCFIRDQKARLLRERHGDGHALPHAPRKLMRILVHAQPGLMHLHFSE